MNQLNRTNMKRFYYEVRAFQKNLRTGEPLATKIYEFQTLNRAMSRAEDIARDYYIVEVNSVVIDEDNDIIDHELYTYWQNGRPC